jgi:hypothetical protein
MGCLRLTFKLSWTNLKQVRAMYIALKKQEHPNINKDGLSCHQ